MEVVAFSSRGFSVTTDDKGFNPIIWDNDEYAIEPEAVCDLVNFLVSAGALKWNQEDWGHPVLTVTAS